MTEYDNTNRFALFPNDRKEKDSHPDMKGPININGVEYELAAWRKRTKKGEEMWSGSVKPKMAREHQGAPSNPPVPKRDDFDDELPPF